MTQRPARYAGPMADHDTRSDDRPVELLEMPAGAEKLTTIGMASKTPGRCACGEHPDPDEHAEAADH